MATKVINDATGEWSISGTTATYKVGGVVVAKLTGLKSGLSTEALEKIVTAGSESGAGTIGLTESLLGTSKVSLTLSNGGSYKLAFTNTATITVLPPTISNGKVTVKGNVEAGWIQTDDKTITKKAAAEGVTLATVSGLNTKIKALTEEQAKKITEANEGDVGLIDSEGDFTKFSALVDAETTDGTIEIKQAAFTTSKISLTSNYGYKITLDKTDDTNEDGVIGGEPEDPVWSVSGTTATYKQTTSAKYVLAADGKSVAYTKASTATIATIKGLAKGITVKDGSSVGIGKDEDFAKGLEVTKPYKAAEDDDPETQGEITLSSNVLAQSGSATLTVTKGYGTYNLVIGDGVNPDFPEGKDKPEKTTFWTISGTTAYFKEAIPTYYTLDNNNKITAHVDSGTTLATVKGLASGLVAKNDGIYSADGNTTVIKIEDDKKYVAAADKDNPETEDVDESKPQIGEITIKADALNKKTVSVSSSQYKLVVDNDVEEPKAEDPAWTISGTTATYKGDIGAGYTLSADGKTLTYSKAKTGATIVTISGLAKAPADEEDKKKITDALTLDPETKEITIGSDALGTSTISVSKGYTIKLDDNDIEISIGTVTTTGGKTTVTPPADSIKNVWSISGTTAYYKEVIPAYWTEENGKIVYHKETVNRTLATITGLKKGLVAKNEEGSSGIFDTEDKKVIQINEGKEHLDKKEAVIVNGEEEIAAQEFTSGTITISKGALSTSAVANSIKDSDSKKYYYNLAFDETEVSRGDFTAAPVGISAATWSVSGTKATLKGAVTAGYKLDAENNKITYSAAQSNAVIAEITNLKSGLTANDLNKDGALISLDDTNESQFNVKLGALGTDKDKPLTITGKYGDFTLDMDYTAIITADDDSVKDGNKIWVEDKDNTGTYSYVNYKAAHYTYGSKTDPDDATKTIDDKTKIVYNADDSSDVLVTVKGLKSDLNIITDTTDDNYGKIGKEVDDNGKSKFVEDIDISSSTITVNLGALDGSNIEITKVKEGETFTLAAGDDVKESIVDIILSFDDKHNLIIKKGKTEGYALDETKEQIVHTEEKSKTVATVTGLASNLVIGTADDKDAKSDSAEGKIGIITTVKDDDGEEKDVFTEVITISEVNDTDKTITILSRAALGTTNVKITDNTDEYKFVLKDDFTAKTAKDKGWVIDKDDKTKAYLVSYTTAGYTLNNDSDVLTYQEADFGNKPAENALATITGLKSGLTPDVFTGKIGGISIGEESDGEEDNKEVTITLDKKVLGENDIKFTDKYDDAIDYKIDLVGGLSAGYETSWEVKSGKATYTEINKKGWDLVKGTETITVPAAEVGEDPKEKDITTYSVAYTPDSTIKTEISGLSGNVIVGSESHKYADGADAEGKLGYLNSNGDFVEGVTVDKDGDDNNIFSLVDKGALKNDKISLKNGKGADGKTNTEYKLELADGVGAETEEAVWNKTNKETKATLTQETKAGFRQKDSVTVTYSTGKTTETLAVVNGINKNLVAEDSLIAGVEVTTDDETGKNIIRLDKEALAASNVTIDKKYGYDLAINGDAADYAVAEDEVHFVYDKSGKASLVSGTTEGWAFKQTAGADTPDDPDDDVFDYKQLTYTGAKHTALATVNGLKKNLNMNSDGDFVDSDGEVLEGNYLDFIEATAADTAAGISAADGTIILGAGILDSTKISLGNNDKYQFAFNAEDEEDILAKPFENADKVWYADGKGNLNYQYDAKEAWEIGSDGKSVTYAKEHTETLATIKNISKDVKTQTVTGSGSTAIPLPTAAALSGIEIEAPDVDEDGKPIANTGLITITDESIFAGGNVTLTSGNYNLAVDDELNRKDFDEPRWYLSGSNLLLKDGKTEGYENASESNNKSITHYAEKAETVLATITGFTGLKIGTRTDSLAPNDDDVRESALGKIGYVVRNETVENSAGSIVSISNVFHEWNPDYTVSGDGEGIIDLQITDKTIGILGTKDISVISGAGYSIAFAENENLAPSITAEAHWSVGSGTAKWIQTTNAGFTLDEDKPGVFKYNKEKKDEALVTIGGLNKNLKLAAATDSIYAEDPKNIKLVDSDDVGKFAVVKKIGNKNYVDIIDYSDDSDAPVYVDEDGIVTVKKEALEGTTKVTISSGYQLKIDDSVLQFAKETTDWVVDKTTATYKTYNQAYYDIDSVGAVNYHTASKGTDHLTITGLASTNSGLADDFNNASGIFDATKHEITLGDAQLAKKAVALKSGGEKYNGYKLVLDDAIDEKSELVDSGKGLGWTVKSGTATLKGTQTKGYLLADDGLSISYSSSDKAVNNVATIKGLKNNVEDIDETNKVITLTADSLGTANVVLTSNYGYEFSLNGTAPAVSLQSGDSPWTINSGGNATLKGAVTTAGHTLSLDKKTAVYTAATAANKSVGLATIKGVASTATIDADKDHKTITLDKADISGNSVTVTGGLFAVEFSGADKKSYDNASIFGSANSDTISIGGSKVSINTAKGDDKVDLGTNKENIFFYASGDGNDVIANFDATDKIKLTNSTITAANITTDGNDALIKVSTGSIRLYGWGTEENAIHIVDKDDKEKIYSWSKEHNTFLSKLVEKPSSNAYVLGDIETTQTPELVKKDAIAYGGNDKK